MILTNDIITTLVPSLIILGVLFISAILIIVFFVINMKENDRVKKTSPYYLEIEKIYRSTQFKEVNIRYSKDYNVLNSKRKFDAFNYSKRCIEYICYNSSEFINIVDAIEYNKATLNEYNKKIASVPHTNDEELAKSIKLSLKSMVNRETKLVRGFVKHPVVNYQIKVTASYTSPKGRNSYRWTNTFDYNFIKKCVEAIRPSSFSSYIINNTYSSDPKEPEKINTEPEVSVAKEEISESVDKKYDEPKSIDRPTNSPKTGRIINSIDDLEEID